MYSLCHKNCPHRPAELETVELKAVDHQRSGVDDVVRLARLRLGHVGHQTIVRVPPARGRPDVNQLPSVVFIQWEIGHPTGVREVSIADEFAVAVGGTERTDRPGATLVPVRVVHHETHVAVRSHPALAAGQFDERAVVCRDLDVVAERLVEVPHSDLRVLEFSEFHVDVGRFDRAIREIVLGLEVDVPPHESADVQPRSTEVGAVFEGDSLGGELIVGTPSSPLLLDPTADLVLESPIGALEGDVVLRPDLPRLPGCGLLLREGLADDRPHLFLGQPVLRVGLHRSAQHRDDPRRGRES